jgi:hypothetical protein
LTAVVSNAGIERKTSENRLGIERYLKQGLQELEIKTDKR